MELMIIYNTVNGNYNDNFDLVHGEIMVLWRNVVTSIVFDTDGVCSL